jgi:hypothetical protein
LPVGADGPGPVIGSTSPAGVLVAPAGGTIGATVLVASAVPVPAAVGVPVATPVLVASTVPVGTVVPVAPGVFVAGITVPVPTAVNVG